MSVTTKTMRVRTDELLISDLLEVRTREGVSYAPIVSITSERKRTAGGATLTRWYVTPHGFLAFSTAPHARHTVRRIQEGTAR